MNYAGSPAVANDSSDVFWPEPMPVFIPLGSWRGMLAAIAVKSIL